MRGGRGESNESSGHWSKISGTLRGQDNSGDSDCASQIVLSDEKVIKERWFKHCSSIEV